MSLVEARGLYFRYPGRHASNPGRWRTSTSRIERGAAVGVVGESGSGKSTLVRILCGLMAHQRGEV